MGRGHLSVSKGEAGSSIWAGLARAAPALDKWTNASEDDDLYTHLLLFASDETACGELAALVLDEHDARFEDFVFLEPLADRVERGVVDPLWAANCEELDADHRVCCSDRYHSSDLIRPLEQTADEALWAGWLNIRPAGEDEDELLGAIAIASREEEFEATVADYAERGGLTPRGWVEKGVVASRADAPLLLARFPESIVYTSSAEPEFEGTGVWGAAVEASYLEGEGPGATVGAFVQVLASASSEVELAECVRTWFGRWDMGVVAFDDVCEIGGVEGGAALSDWVRDHFGFFHGRFHCFPGDEDD